MFTKRNAYTNILQIVAILSVINIVIVFWIVWFERQIQYEPLLDYDSNIGAKLLPLHSEVYNTMIIAIIINMIVLAFESRTRRIRKYMKCDLIIAFAYLFLITFCMMAGYFFILSRIQDGVIDEHNALFRYALYIFVFVCFICIRVLKNIRDAKRTCEEGITQGVSL